MADFTFNSKSLNTALPEITTPTNISAVISGDQAAVSGANGNFHYKVTAFNGGETLASSGISISGTGAPIAVFADVVAGATNYRLYRSGENYFDFILASQGSGLPLLDTFSTSGDTPPILNTTSFKSRSATDSPTTFYLVSGIPKTLVKEIMVANAFTQDTFFDIHFIPSGETANIGNASFYNVSLSPNETKIISLNTVLQQGDFIQVRSSILGTTAGFGTTSVKISGIEITEE